MTASNPPNRALAPRQWLNLLLLAAIGLSALSVIPALKRNTQLLLESPGLVSMPTFKRQALNRGAFQWQEITVSSGQTISGMFEQAGIDQTTLALAAGTDSGKAAFRRIRPGDVLEFEINGYGTLRTLRFDRSDLEQAVLTFGDGGVTEQVIQRKLEQRTMVASGEITRSLYADAKRAGLDSSVVNQIADVFKYDIDFSEDLKDGDTFQVVYEQSFLEGEPYRQGRILAARFSNSGKTYSAFRYNAGSREEFFDADGRPLKKVLLRIPIEFARLSSTFGMRRHPVLGRMRAHKGVDYAARTGTPILAAGDGRVEFAGWKNGYGKTVIINHGQGRSTLYGHMSSFGKYRSGQHVPQGAVIGRVGSTGLATGPHLHYEFRVGGKQVNPLKVTMPKPEPLRGPALERFRNATAPAVAMMDESAASTFQ